MSDTIRLLESRVDQAVREIRRLRADRDALTREIESLKRQAEDRSADDESGGWRDERERVVRELREALVELESA